jgi:hypothetical protein
MTTDEAKKEVGKMIEKRKEIILDDQVGYVEYMEWTLKYEKRGAVGDDTNARSCKSLANSKERNIDRLKKEVEALLILLLLS